MLLLYVYYLPKRHYVVNNIIGNTSFNIIYNIYLYIYLFCLNDTCLVSIQIVIVLYDDITIYFLLIGLFLRQFLFL